MSDKPKWMRDLPRIKAQAEFEGKKEELADLDRYGIRPILAALEATGQSSEPRSWWRRLFAGS